MSCDRVSGLPCEFGKLVVETWSVLGMDAIALQ